MRKSKLAVGLMTAILSAGVLASCDNTVKYGSNGVILTYNGQEITADQLLVDYYSDSTKYQSIFDSIYSIVVRNYFNNTEIITKYQGKDVNIPLGKEQMKQIEIDAQSEVDSDKRTAKTNAKTNNKSYKEEFEAILTSKGVETEEELFDKYVEEKQKAKFDENFYKYHIDVVKNGSEEAEGMWKGYFEDMVPYHVSHILVKLSDSSATNYSNGTISEDDAKHLVSIVDNLKNAEDSFSTIADFAREYGDSGSAAKGGNLGIMDYSTGYVNEFKLGVYAYENFLGNNTADVTKSNIAIPDVGETSGIATDFKAVVKESFDGNEISTIDYEVFSKIDEYKDTTKDEKGKAVLDDDANFYPRNIVYNKYLNRHSVAFITATADSGESLKEASAQRDGYTGFHTYTQAENQSLFNLGKAVLSVKSAGAWTPLLVTRAGTGDYQGIHFIYVNRSPFDGGADKVVNGVSLDDYYTTYYPGQDGYPTDANGADLKTYVNFASTDQKDTMSTAEGFVSTLKSYDSDKLNKFIYRKYFADEKIKFSDDAKELEKALNTWIDRSIEKKEQETDEAWVKTWNEYIDTLRKQNSERTKLVSQACRIGYAEANNKDEAKLTELLDEMVAAMIKAGEFQEGHEADAKAKILTTAFGEEVKTVADLFKLEGGLCNNGKAHL